MLASCSTTRVAVDVMVYPDADLRYKMTNLALINRVDYSNGFTKQFVNGVIVEQYTDLTEFYTDETLRSLEKRLNADGFVKARIIKPAYVRHNGSFNSDVLPSTVINRICLDNDVDGVIAVEGYDAEIDSDGNVHFSTPVETNYGTVRIPYFEGSQAVQMRMLFRVYACNTRKNILLESEVSTQISANTTGSSPQEVDNRLPHSDNALFQAADQIGNDFATQIIPHWRTVQRKIYVPNDERMELAASYALDGNWKEAIEEWYIIAAEGSKLSAKAAYNLIVASEVTGDIDLAIRWATTCAEKFGMSAAFSYLAELKERKEEIEKIERYFPGEQ